MMRPRLSSCRLTLPGAAALFLTTFLIAIPAGQAPSPQGGAPAAEGGRQGRGRGGDVPASQGRGRGVASPASQRGPATTTPQTYPAELVAAGQVLFASQCGFCHGRDAMGGEIGPDLTRSALVAEDVRGDKISLVVRNGRPEKKMPAFNLSDTDMAAVVAFIHDAKAKAETLAGNRRTVDPADLQTGDAAAGERYFNGAGGCVKCHSSSGDLAGVASRFQGLSLMQRMLYPSGRGARGAAPAATATVTVMLPSGESIRGKLAYRDEFTIGLRDSAGTYRSWSASRVKYTIDDPLDAHFAQLGKYTNEDLHNVLAYLQTLK